MIHLINVTSLKLICNIIDSTEPPFNIAVIGKWGLGKSSLMALKKYENNCDESMKCRSDFRGSRGRVINA